MFLLQSVPIYISMLFKYIIVMTTAIYRHHHHHNHHQQHQHHQQHHHEHHHQHHHQRQHQHQHQHQQQQHHPKKGNNNNMWRATIRKRNEKNTLLRFGWSPPWGKNIVSDIIWKSIWHIFSDILFGHSIWHSILTFYSGILSGICSVAYI